MLNLRKLPTNLRLLRKRAVGPYEFSPKNMLDRVRDQVVHPRYVAQALMDRLKESWHVIMTNAMSKGDTATEEYYKNLINEYSKKTFNNPDDVWRVFKDDPSWPFPYDRTPSSESKERTVGIPNTPEGAALGAPTGKPTETYDMDQVQQVRTDIERDALQLEKEQVYLMVTDAVQGGFGSYGVYPNSHIPFSEQSKRRQQMVEGGEEPPEDVFVDADNYNDMVQKTVNHLMNSSALFKGKSQYQDPFVMGGPDVSPDDLYNAFSKYISKIAPAFVNRYVDDVIVGQEMESLDEPMYSEEGRQETRLDKLEDPTALPAVETGAGTISPELDVLSGLSILERMQGVPIEDYVQSNAFKMHSILQMLRPLWKGKIETLSKTPANEDLIRKYKHKLSLSDNIHEVDTPAALSKFVDDTDIALLGDDPKTIISMIDKNREEYLGEILWNSVLQPEGRTPIEKKEFLKNYQRVLEEKPEDVSFNQFLDTKQAEYESIQGDQNIQPDLKGFQEIVDTIGREYGSKAQELLQIYLDVMQLPKEARGEDITGYIVDVWNDRYPESTITSNHVNAFLDNKVRPVLDDMKRHYEVDLSATSTPATEEVSAPTIEPKKPLTSVSPAIVNPQLVRWQPGETGVHSQWPREQVPFEEDPAAIEQYKKLLSEGLSLRRKKNSLSLWSKVKV